MQDYLDLTLYIPLSDTAALGSGENPFFKTTKTIDKQASIVCPLFQALGDPDRLKIVMSLMENGRLSIAEISTVTGLEQERVEECLIVLNRSGLVGTYPPGPDGMSNVSSLMIFKLHKWLQNLYDLQSWGSVLE